MIALLSALSGASSLKDGLDRANYAVQDKLARFLASGQRIINLRDRAKAVKSDPLVSVGNSLLGELSTTQGRAITTMGQASALRSKMETDPFWKNVLANPTGTLSAAKDAISQAAALGKDLADVGAEMDAHVAKVDDYAQAVSKADGKDPGAMLAGSFVFSPVVIVGSLVLLGGVIALSRRGK